MKVNVTVITLFLLVSAVRGQQVLHVPASFPTIQGAIVAANPGDTIQVAAGLYVENLDFLGKEIQLIGTGIGQTILDGGQNGTVISMTGVKARVPSFKISRSRTGRGPWSLQSVAQ